MRPHKVRKTESGFKYAIYLPEVHYCTVDYWGEADEHGLVDGVLDYLGWKHGKVTEDEMWPDISACWWLHSRTALIKWLSLLPVKVHDSKINKVLKLNYD